MKKIVREGEEIPKGYGIAWLNLAEYTAIAYPIPINMVLGFLRKIWINMRYGEWIKTGYDEGYLRGAKEGREYAYNQHAKLALRGQLEDILKRFSEYELDMLGRNKEEQAGWFWKFLKQEEKRLYEQT